MLRGLLWGADPARRHAADRARVPPHDGRRQPGRSPEHRCAGAAVLPHLLPRALPPRLAVWEYVGETATCRARLHWRASVKVTNDQ